MSGKKKYPRSNIKCSSFTDPLHSVNMGCSGPDQTCSADVQADIDLCSLHTHIHTQIIAEDINPL